MLAILLALQLSIAPGMPRGKGVLPPDSVLRMRVDSATRAFQDAWRFAWADTQHERPARLSGDNPYDTDERSLALHCHSVEPPWQIRKYIIKSSVRAQAVCPMWYARDGATLDDERRGIDGGLARNERGAIRVLRARLRSLLDSVARQLPGDARIASSRVRFALDAQAFADAWEAATACTSDAVQCGFLRGLVHYRAGHIFSADSTFLVAAAMMPEKERCNWTNIAVLLDPETRASYDALDCGKRAELERKVWWLADPLYLEPGNERRAEHFARKTLIAILSQLEVDERQRWRAEKGGEAIAESIIRYGWPSQMYWGGAFVDRAHDGWLRAHLLDTAGPYVARQYTRDRLHTLPAARAIAAPFTSVAEDWTLNAPNSDDDWPVEHFARDASRMIQLPAGQSVAWRRQGAARFVWAVDLDARALTHNVTDTLGAVAFESRVTNDVTTIGAFSARLGKPLVVDAAMPAGDALLSIEIPGDTAHAAARTRFGQRIPEPLRAGAEPSLSQPVLLDQAYDASVQIDADAATAHMLGTTTLSKPRRVGIYWEAYGFAATDTVDLEVQISREDRPGVFSRVLGVFRLGQEQDAKVGIRWREGPGNSRAMQRLEADVPMQMRSVALDVAGLSRGNYRLQITMSRLGGAAVASDRAFVIR